MPNRIASNSLVLVEIGGGIDHTVSPCQHAPFREPLLRLVLGMLWTFMKKQFREA